MRWVIAYVPEGHEFTFKSQMLHRYGIKVYVPTVIERRPATRRLPERIGDAPMFGNYVFVPKVEGWEKVYHLDLLLYIITFEDKPIEVSDKLIDNLRLLEGDERDLGSQKKDIRIGPGSLVKITCGPLANIPCIALDGTRGKWVNTVIAGEPVRVPRCIVENL